MIKVENLNVETEVTLSLKDVVTLVAVLGNHTLDEVERDITADFGEDIAEQIVAKTGPEAFKQYLNNEENTHNLLDKFAKIIEEAK